MSFLHCNHLVSTYNGFGRRNKHNSYCTQKINGLLLNNLILSVIKSPSFLALPFSLGVFSLISQQALVKHS